MKTIIKHGLPASSGHYELQLPRGSDVVAFVCRRGNFELHAVYDTVESSENEQREFLVTKLDEEITLENQLVYIGNAQNGTIVSHLFEVVPLFSQVIQ